MTHRWRKFVFRTGTVLVFATAVLGPTSAAFADPVNPTPSTDGMPGAALWNQVLVLDDAVGAVALPCSDCARCWRLVGVGIDG